MINSVNNVIFYNKKSNYKLKKIKLVLLNYINNYLITKILIKIIKNNYSRLINKLLCRNKSIIKSLYRVYVISFKLFIIILVFY